jgi:hypothetical protein
MTSTTTPKSNGSLTVSSSNSSSGLLAPLVTTSEELIKAQNDHSAHAGIIGGSLSWQIAEATNVSFSDLNKLAKLFSIPEKYLPNEKKPGTAWRQTCANITSKPKGYSLKPLNKADSKLKMVALIKEGVRKDAVKLATFDLQHEVTFTFDPETEAINVGARSQGWEETANLICEEMRNLYPHYRNHTREDFVKLCHDFVEDKGVVINPGSTALRFIPKAFYQEALEIQAFLAECTPESNFFLLPVPADNQTQFIAKESKKILEEEISELEQEISEFTDAILDSEIDVDGKRCQNKIQRFLDIKSRIDAYADQFQINIDRLANNLDELNHYMLSLQSFSIKPEKPEVVEDLDLEDTDLDLDELDGIEIEEPEIEESLPIIEYLDQQQQAKPELEEPVPSESLEALESLSSLPIPNQSASQPDSEDLEDVGF